MKQWRRGRRGSVNLNIIPHSVLARGRHRAGCYVMRGGGLQFMPHTLKFNFKTITMLCNAFSDSSNLFFAWHSKEGQLWCLTKECYTHTHTPIAPTAPFLISSFPQESRFQLELFVQRWADLRFLPDWHFLCWLLLSVVLLKYSAFSETPLDRDTDAEVHSTWSRGSFFMLLQ